MKKNVEDVRITQLVMAVAKTAHQANKAWCESEGDMSQKDWDDAEEWQRSSALDGVQFRIVNPNAGSDAMHNNWMKQKLDEGWKYGPVKDVEKKEHHCIVPFDQLPEFQQKKDKLFSGVVDALIVKFDIFDFISDTNEDEMNSQEIIADKQLRVNLDEQLQNVKSCPPSRERSLCITKLQEAIMWLGMDMKRLNSPNPYPNSYKPENDKVEPTADNLKL